MRTEASVYEDLLTDLIAQVESRMHALDEKGIYTPQDEIDYAALDRLLDRLENLEGY